jgi:hypothetical protein
MIDEEPITMKPVTVSFLQSLNPWTQQCEILALCLVQDVIRLNPRNGHLHRRALSMRTNKRPSGLLLFPVQDHI